MGGGGCFEIRILTRFRQPVSIFQTMLDISWRSLRLRRPLLMQIVLKNAWYDFRMCISSNAFTISQSLTCRICAFDTKIADLQYGKLPTGETPESPWQIKQFSSSSAHALAAARAKNETRHGKRRSSSSPRQFIWFRHRAQEEGTNSNCSIILPQHDNFDSNYTAL